MTLYVCDRREAERQHMSKMAILGDLSGGLAHQVNNIFNLIYTDATFFLDMYSKAASQKEVEEQRTALLDGYKDMLSESERGCNLVKAMQTMAREPLDPQPVKLSYITKRALALLSAKRSLEKVSIIEEYDANGPLIWVSTSYAPDIFYNIIDNAYDAIEEKDEKIKQGLLKEENYNGKITIRAKPLKDHISVEIEDNGLGIEEKHLLSVGQPCYTTKAGRKRGTGFGVSTVKKLLEASGGKMEIKSTYTKGTVFSFTLPLATEEQIKDYRDNNKEDE